MSAETSSQGPLFAGKYRFIRMLGKGAMGEVWLAEEEGPRNFRRRVAVKRLLSVGDLGDYATDSFVAEAQVIARLDHPNVVRLIELGNSEGGLYLVLEFVDGAALDRIYKRTGAMSPAAVAYLGREVARALEAVHGMCDDAGQNYGVVHRDVTPSNILVARDGRVRLSDFGVARISGLGGEKTETGVFKGKLPYMPPEQARGEPFDGRADVFALGVSLFEGLCGKRLRRAETQTQLLMMISREPLPRVRELVPSAPELLVAALDRACELNASGRPDAGDLAVMFDDALRQLGPGALKEAQAELRARVEQVAGAPAGSPGSPSAQRASALPQGPREWSMPLGTGAGPGSMAQQSAAPGTGAGGWRGPEMPGQHARGSAPPGTGSGSYGSAPSTGSLQGGAYPPGSYPPGHPGFGPPSGVTNVASFSDASGNPAGRRRGWVIPVVALSGFMVLGGVLAFVMLSRRTPDAPLTSSSAAPAPTVVEAAPQPTAAPLAVAAPSAEPAEIDLDEPAPQPSNAPVTGVAIPHGTRPVTTGRPPSATTSATASAADEGNEPGTLHVSVSPWADVSVDGRAMGTTPLAPMSLAPGPHSVVLRNSELGASRSISVTIKPGKPTQVRVDLRRTE
ncbi:serine/threonine protein kinase [Polyangium aurulentum]|uniref:serine/threonine protein kinase n=1 Tax=Polyangium aurulentum TaxID=2567896 RepID=UPI0010AE783C|nr:serine/threonine-protein kinase [Polyangium aurulentum]UQA59623.1 protein kinase [Polyangium aurulentum]